jgi:hypothetical protein
MLRHPLGWLSAILLLVMIGSGWASANVIASRMQFPKGTIFSGVGLAAIQIANVARQRRPPVRRRTK